MNIYKTTIQYIVTREVEIITAESLNDSEIAEKAKELDTSIPPVFPLISLSSAAVRLILAGSPCEIVKIERVTL